MRAWPASHVPLPAPSAVYQPECLTVCVACAGERALASIEHPLVSATPNLAEPACGARYRAISLLPRPQPSRRVARASCRRASLLSALTQLDRNCCANRELLATEAGGQCLAQVEAFGLP